MTINRGKQFEYKFKSDFQKSFPNGTIDRIYDVVSGMKSITNISDFVAYNFPNIFYTECKSHGGASLPLCNITQYEKLKAKVGIPGVRAGVILWLQDKDKVYYIPIATVTQLKKDGKKSVGVKAVEEGYRIIEIPSIKKRVFMDSDYSVLMQLHDGD